MTFGAVRWRKGIHKSVLLGGSAQLWWRWLKRQVFGMGSCGRIEIVLYILIDVDEKSDLFWVLFCLFIFLNPCMQVFDYLTHLHLKQQQPP